MPRSVVSAVVSLVLLSGVIWALSYHDRPPSEVRPLVVLAAPTVREPLGAVAADFTRDTGRPVVIDCQPSEQLLTTARFPPTHRPADLLIPADDSYLASGRDHGLLDHWTPIARVHAVLLLRPHNPRRIGSWSDLHADGVRIAIPNDSAAVGKLTRDHLARTGAWYPLRPRVIDSLNVTDAATAARAGSVDAAVVWDAVAAGPGYRGQEVVRVSELADVRGTVAAGVLKQSPEPDVAADFLEYLTRHGGVHWRAAGFNAP